MTSQLHQCDIDCEYNNVESSLPDMTQQRQTVAEKGAKYELFDGKTTEDMMRESNRSYFECCSPHKKIIYTF